MSKRRKQQVPVIENARLLAAHLSSLEDDQQASLTLLGFALHASLQIPDEKWKRMVRSAETPCGKNGCRCHVHAAQIMQGLDAVRDDYRESAPPPSALFDEIAAMLAKAGFKPL